MNDHLVLFAHPANQRLIAADPPGTPIRFVASTEGVKRDGKDLKAENWDLANYRKNPVFLFGHDYMGARLPIGRSDAFVQGRQLIADVTFDQQDDFARAVESKYRRGYLSAVSVGWQDLIRCKRCKGLLDASSTYGLDHYRKKCPHCERELTQEDVELKYDLLDISAVPVPGDPDALKLERMAVRSLSARLKLDPKKADDLALQTAVRRAVEQGLLIWAGQERRRGQRRVVAMIMANSRRR